MRTILITGGTGDLARTVVPRLLREYRCAVVYRSAESWRKLVADLGESDALVGIAGLERVAEAGPLYGVVMLAGAFGMGSSPDDFSRMFDVNVLTAVRTLEAARDQLEDGGRVIAISSSATLAKAGPPAYVVSKAALNTLVEVTAKELRKRRITMNAVAPNAMNTPENVASMPPDQLVPTERVAETIAFLLSEASANITGQIIPLT